MPDAGVSAARRLAALRVLDAPAWRAEVRAALRAHGSVPAAAAALGVTRRSVERWLREEPALAAGLALPGRGRPRTGDA